MSSSAIATFSDKSESGRGPEVGCTVFYLPPPRSGVGGGGEGSRGAPRDLLTDTRNASRGSSRPPGDGAPGARGRRALCSNDRADALLVTGKSVNAKDVLEDKKDDSELWEAQAAFLGPNLWDKTLPYDPDLKYVDLDEFLSENGMAGEALGGAHLGGSAFGAGAGLALGLQPPVTKRERSPSPSDCMSPDTINPPLSPADSTFSMASSGRDFDPRTRAFSDEELKPQPMIKKSRKQFVPDDLKDDKYWARRRKNNMAAKRSRDARRMKENQIALRAGYLEKENMGLRQEAAEGTAQIHTTPYEQRHRPAPPRSAPRRRRALAKARSPGSQRVQ
ncbi:unnamed protein product [Pieris brassicae]|uniref:BZIP domain-containing protein n=1 Tax=Pieris brassicae TaxID=7116 RepID=A0A9P0TV77_PIEBR|nr:unnamed protein product [Pieris brassicae]